MLFKISYRKKENKAKLISGGSSTIGLQKSTPDLLERTFGDAIASIRQDIKPPVPESNKDANQESNES